MSVLQAIKRFKNYFSLKLSLAFTAITVIAFIYSLTDFLDLNGLMNSNASMVLALAVKPLQIGLIVFILSYIFFIFLVENSLSNKVWYKVKERSYIMSRLEPSEIKKYEIYRNKNGEHKTRNSK